MIIGITGTLGAGKTTAANYLKSKGFQHFSVRQFIADEAHRQGLPINRETLTMVANQIRAQHGPDYIVIKLIEAAKKQDDPAVIESIRTVGEAEGLKKHGGYLMAINANAKLRYERASLESGITAPQSFEEFIAQEEHEMHSEDPRKQNVSAVMLRADAQILNNGTTLDLEKQIDAFLDQIEQSQ
ncbi:MAG TPA: AAA family ATPase [Candidatus Paceibacterota bacterium]|nr:AAA family ATPase [Candidatus Paceibacterota bacterium]